MVIVVSVTWVNIFSVPKRDSKSPAKADQKPIDNIKKDFFQKLQANQMLSLDISSDNDTMGPDLPMLDADLMSKFYSVQI